MAYRSESLPELRIEDVEATGDGSEERAERARIRLAEMEEERLAEEEAEEPGPPRRTKRR